MSSIHLSDNHHILSSANDVQTICDPFMRLFNLTYFDYCKIYHDGRMSVLANDPYWVKHFFSVNYPAGGEVRRNGIYLWPTHLPADAITDARCQFNHDNGMTVIYEHEDHIEFFDCASDRGFDDILYYYINHFDIFERFIAYFKSEAAALIKKSDMCFINILSNDPHNMDNSRVRDAELLLGYNQSLLSKQQKECLRLFANGMTMKQIAETMSLSPRTVEHYFDMIKSKLSCASRYDLIQKAFEFKLV